MATWDHRRGDALRPDHHAEHEPLGPIKADPAELIDAYDGAGEGTYTILQFPEAPPATTAVPAARRRELD